jgi:hypothetical protein
MPLGIFPLLAMILLARIWVCATGFMNEGNSSGAVPNLDRDCGNIPMVDRLGDDCWVGEQARGLLRSTKSRLCSLYIM